MDEPIDQYEQSDCLKLKAAYIALIEGYVRKRLCERERNKGEDDNGNDTRAV